MYQELTAGERSVYQMEKYVCRDGNVVWGAPDGIVDQGPNQSPLTIQMVNLSSNRSRC